MPLSTFSLKKAGVQFILNFEWLRTADATKEEARGGHLVDLKLNMDVLRTFSKTESEIEKNRTANASFWWKGQA